MKAIIPVAGIGTRLRPHTHTQPKSLIPVAGKPIIAHIVDQLVSAGIKDIVFVIGYLGDKIEEFILKNYPNLNAEFVIQTSGKGTGHAVWLAKDNIKNEEILIVFGDTICEVNWKEIINHENSLIGLKKVDDPQNFGVAEIDAQNNILKMVEKPNIPKSNLAIVGIYKIRESEELIKCIEKNIEQNIKTQNEFHLTDALMCMIQNGAQFKSFKVDTWFDCGKKEILLQTNQLLLKRQSQLIEDKILKNNIIIQPVKIGENCTLNNCIIGPNVSIGDHAIIEYSIIKESIIGPHAEIKNAVLNQSLIGNDALLHGTVHSLNLGDSAEINYN